MARESNARSYLVQRSDEVARPRPVIIAFWLWTLEVTMHQIGLLLFLLSADDEEWTRTMARIAAFGGSRPGPVPRTGTLVALIVAATAMWMMAVFAMRAGRGGARKLLAACGVADVVFLLTLLCGASGTSVLPVGMTVLVVVEIAAIVTMLWPGIVSYFRGR